MQTSTIVTSATLFYVQCIKSLVLLLSGKQEVISMRDVLKRLKKAIDSVDLEKVLCAPAAIFMSEF